MSPRQQFLDLRRSSPAILPSLLLCDFGDMRGELERLEATEVPALHLDVMDGRFVPNLSYGMPIVSGIRNHTSLPLDVHLMIEQPERYVGSFVEAGADAVTIHVEATDHPREVLKEIRRLGAAAGLALNPDTPLTALDGCLDACDLVLVMSVQAGFGGQSFQPVALEKLAALRAGAGDYLLEVDGGVNPDTIASCTAAGAELLVVGSAIFGQPNYADAVGRLHSLATHAKEAS